MSCQTCRQNNADKISKQEITVQIRVASFCVQMWTSGIHEDQCDEVVHEMREPTVQIGMPSIIALTPSNLG